MFVEPNEFRILCKVFDRRIVRLIVFVAQDPAEMTPQEPSVRIVRISVRVREAMMPTVMARPPKCALLSAGSPSKGNEEGHEAIHAVRPVRKVPVIATCDEKHPDHIQSHAEDDVACGRREEDHPKGKQVEDEERN